MTQVSVEAVPEASPGPGDQGVWLSGAKGATRRFFWWGTLAYLVTVAALLVMSLRRTGGRLIYLIDDPAIHMSVARNLALHGTWGVTPGHFQSASSSPLWTVLLAGWIRVAPSTMSLAPLLLNLGSGVLVIWILANSQRLLAPGRTRPFDTPGVAGLVVCVLFLPALAMLGMEHTLHMALILAAVVLSLAYVNHGANWGGRWMPYLMVALATLVRFETLFVVAGLAIGLVATRRSTLTRHPSSPIDRRAWRCTIGLLAASVTAAVGFSIFNLAMGQGVLPNSVLAKAQTTSGAGSFGPVQILNRFTSDPVLSALWAILAVSTVLAWRRIRDLRALAVTALVAVGLHVTFAQVGFFERYQAYLIGLMCLALLAVGTLLLSESDRVPTARAVIPCVIAVLMLFTATKSSLTLKVPVAVDDTYQQRYQAGRFLARYYEGQPVATGELGYISLLHKGPITDLYGLGDYEVLQERRRTAGNPPSAYWDALARSRGFKVVVVYPRTLFFSTPSDWILVGRWHLNRPAVTAFEPTIQFWATTPSEVRPLEAHLRAFAHSLPGSVALDINPLAEFRASRALSK